MNSLNNIQSREAVRARTLARFLNKSKSSYARLAPFGNEVASFLANVNQLSLLATQKEKKGTGITLQKNKLKKTIAREGADLCSIITVYAINTNNTTLEYLCRHSYTNLYTLRDVEVLGFANTMVAAITPLLTKEDFAAYNITAHHLSALLHKATQYSHSIGAAKIMNHSSYYASQQITATLKKIKVNIAQFYRLLPFLSQQQPQFAAALRQAATISQTGIRHNAVEGAIKNSITGEPVAGVTITTENGNKTAATNASGIYRLSGIKTGRHTFTIAAEGYDTQVIRATIIRGKTVSLNINLAARLPHLPEVKIA